MTYKQLFLAFVALSTAFMLSIVFAADANAEWKQLVKQEGCLASSTDINYTVAGSVFEQKTWKDFLVSVQNDNGLFDFIIDKFNSSKETKLHICNFRNATEGEVAVFVIQRVVGKNWYSYDGNSEKLKVIAQKKVAAKVLLLKDVIEDKEMCKELQIYFKQQNNLK